MGVDTVAVQAGAEQDVYGRGAGHWPGKSHGAEAQAAESSIVACPGHGGRTRCASRGGSMRRCPAAARRVAWPSSGIATSTLAACNYRDPATKRMLHPMQYRSLYWGSALIRRCGIPRLGSGTDRRARWGGDGRDYT
jgi:hypothetical protein